MRDLENLSNNLQEIFESSDYLITTGGFFGNIACFTAKREKNTYDIIISDEIIDFISEELAQDVGGLFEALITGFFGSFFVIFNTKRIKSTFTTPWMKQGAFGELLTFRDYFINLIKQIYFDDTHNIDTNAGFKALSSFHYSCLQQISSDPYYSLSDSTRYPDLSNIMFKLLEDSGLLLLITPIKSGQPSSNYPIENIIVDLISSLYLQSVNNIVELKENVNYRSFKNIKAIASVIDIFHHFPEYNSFKNYFTAFLLALSKLDFYNLQDANNNIKVARRVVREELIIRAINDELVDYPSLTLKE